MGVKLLIQSLLTLAGMLLSSKAKVNSSWAVRKIILPKFESAWTSYFHIYDVLLQEATNRRHGHGRKASKLLDTAVQIKGFSFYKSYTSTLTLFLICRYCWKSGRIRASSTYSIGRDRPAVLFQKTSDLRLFLSLLTFKNVVNQSVDYQCLKLNWYQIYYQQTRCKLEKKAN